MGGGCSCDHRRPRQGIWWGGGGKRVAVDTSCDATALGTSTWLGASGSASAATTSGPPTAAAAAAAAAAAGHHATITK